MNEIKNKKTTSTKRQQIKRNWFNWSEFIFSSPLPVRNKIAKHVCVCVCVDYFFFVWINLISRFVWFLFFCGEGGDGGFIIMKMIQNSQWSDWLIFFSQAKLFALPLISKFFSFVSPLIQLVCYFFFAICSIYCDHYTFVNLNGILVGFNFNFSLFLFCFVFCLFATGYCLCTDIKPFSSYHHSFRKEISKWRKIIEMREKEPWCYWIFYTENKK